MNSNKKTTTFLIAGILAFALLANVTNAPSVFATGGLDDEEEEEAIQQLQNTVEDIQDTLGTIQLNLTSGANDITANCPPPTTTTTTEEETEPEPEQNVTEPPTCPIQPPIEENVTEVIEEIIENVTAEPTCPPTTTTPQPPTIIPGIVLPNITEPVEPPQCPFVQPPPPPPVVVEPPVPTVVPQCPFAPPVENNTTTIDNNNNNLTDGQEIAEIEFDAQCSCFVIDKTPEPNNVEQALSQLGN